MADPHLLDRVKRLRQDMTGPERALWNILRAHRLEGLKFRRQHPVGPFVVDFCCEEHRLVIELDGMTHVGTGEEDDHRDEMLSRMGYRVLRFTNDEVIESIEAVAEEILRTVGKTKT